MTNLPFWLEDFKVYLVDAELLAPAHSSQDSDSEHAAEVVSRSRRHSIYTHFTKDRNWDVCLSTQISSCRRRTGEALLRDEKFGDLITVDHKVLKEECESRNHHQYAVVVQGLATQWIQSYPSDGKEFVKVLGAVTQAKSYLHRQFIRSLEIL